MKILVISPKIIRLGKHIYNEELYRYGRIAIGIGETSGLEFSSEDEIFYKICSFDPNVVIIHMSRNAVDSSDVLRILRAIKKFNIQIIGVGVAFHPHLKYILGNLIDGYTDGSILEYSPSLSSEALRLLQELYRRRNDFIDLDIDFIANFLPIELNAVFPITTSMGCDNSCTFCAYNASRRERCVREPKGIANDISILNALGVSATPFSDINFGINADINANRLQKIHSAILATCMMPPRGLAVNIPVSGLSHNVIEACAELGVIAILCGVESFSPLVREKIFNKRFSDETLFDMAKTCDERGIALICSYIMFHPWSSLYDLRYEMEKIDKLGRQHIPQLFVNSYLRVYPGTMIEFFMRNNSTLYYWNKNKMLIFPDEKITKLYSELCRFYDSKNVDLTSIDSVVSYKIDEMDALRRLVS